MRALGGRRRLVILAVVLAVLVALLMVMRPSGARVVAYFPSAPGLYKGDPVKVMGVVIGHVSSLTPAGDRVRVEMEIGSQPIPAEARAAIVAPSLVSEHFVQLAPAYTAGEKLADGGVIPLSRTAIPVSFDEVKRELTDLATALGPSAGRGGSSGSLNQVIRTLDANLGPDAATQFSKSLAAMRGATESLSAGGDDLFTTLRNLNIFVQNLAVNDRAARDLTVGLAHFSGVLDKNKTQLGSAIAGLDEVLQIVRQFVDENGDALDTGVRNLKEVAGSLASRSNALAGFLHAAPTAVADLYNMIANRAINARVSLNNFHDLSQLLCGSVLGVGGTAAECKAAIGPLLAVLGLRELPRSGGSPKPGATATAPSPNPGVKTGLPLLDGLLASLTGATP